MSRPVVFLTDFGTDDFYAGVMRAVVAAGAPASRIVDLTHGIRPHDIDETSFVLARAFDYTAPDAIIVVVVDPGVGSGRRGVVIEADGRTLVGPDNGFASDLAAAGKIGPFVVIDEDAVSRAAGRAVRGATFHGRDVFAPVAAAIATGASATDFGAETGGVVMLRDVPSVSVDAGRVSGTGRHIDHFGNVLTDIPRGVLEHVFPGLACRVSVDGRNIGPLRRTYSDVPAGELVAILDSWDLVEAAVHGGRAIDRFGGATPRSIRFQLASA